MHISHCFPRVVGGSEGNKGDHTSQVAHTEVVQLVSCGNAAWRILEQWYVMGICLLRSL